MRKPFIAANWKMNKTLAEARAFAEVLARVVAAARPDIATVARPLAEREGKVYVDFLQNGFGKTSLFEAVVLGLFGKDGLRLVLRAGAAADEERRAQSYRAFLKRALNARGLAQGRTECRVTLGFEDEAGEPVEIRRVWHFSGAGDFREEEVTIHKGLARRPVARDDVDDALRKPRVDERLGRREGRIVERRRRRSAEVAHVCAGAERAVGHDAHLASVDERVAGETAAGVGQQQRASAELH